MIKSELVDQLATLDKEILEFCERFISNSYSDFILNNGCNDCDGRGIQKLGNSNWHNNIYFKCVVCNGKTAHHALSFYHTAQNTLYPNLEWDYAARIVGVDFPVEICLNFNAEKSALLKKRTDIAYKLFHGIYEKPLSPVSVGDVVSYENVPYTVMSISDYNEDVLGGFELTLIKQNGRHVRSSLISIPVGMCRVISTLKSKLPKLNGKTGSEIAEGEAVRSKLIATSKVSTDSIFSKTEASYWINLGKSNI